MNNFLGLLIVFFALIPFTAFSQPYPSKPVRLVVPQPAGGPTDAAGRLIAQMLADGLGQNVIVDNRAGAGGTVGTAHVARSKPDGYTLLTATAGILSIAPSLYSRIDYDPIADFQHISLTVRTPTVLVVHPSFPAKTSADLIRIARTKPGQINLASGGNGTASHLTGELFRAMSGINIVHVPYKGSAAAATDIMGGQVEMFFLILNEGLGHVRSGRLKGLATTGPQRSKYLPDLPTVSESGIPGFESVTWYGLSAPAQMPADVLSKLSAAAIQGIKKPIFRERFEAAGYEIMGSTSEAFLTHIKSEMVKWANVIKQSGAKVN
ncbi:MAG: tripartite tricarboxylate transporter substrate binding protein [Burkholderiales bacterium]